MNIRFYLFTKQILFFFLFSWINLTALSNKGFGQIQTVEIFIGDSIQVIKEHQPPFTPTSYITTISFNTFNDPVHAGIDSITVNDQGDALLAHIKLRLDSSAVVGEYYEKMIRVLYVAGQSAVTYTHEFRILAKGDTPPDPPGLVSPFNGAINISPITTFRWDGVPGVINYHIQIAEDNDFSNLVLNKVDVEANSLEFLLPGYQATYYWRIRARNAVGYSDWSSTWMCTTKTMTGLEEEGLVTKFNAYPNPAREWIFIDLFSSSVFNANISIYDSTGKLLSSVNRKVINGDNSLRVSLQGLPAGSYFLRLFGEGEVVSRRFIKAPN